MLGPPCRWSGTARLYRGMSLAQTPPGLPLQGDRPGGTRLSGAAGGGLPCQPRSATRSAAASGSERAWSMFGPHPSGAERFATVASGTSFAQVAGAILRNRAAWRTLIRMRSARQSVIGLAVPGRTGPFRARPGRRPRPARTRVYRATTPAMLAGGHRRAGRWIGLSGQIAADLLPQPGDSRAVDGREGR
jgi:hypothetical protein